MNTNNLIGIPDANVAIYRIFPTTRILDLLVSQKNGLVHPSKWDDPFENFFLRSNLTGPKGELISMSGLAADWYGQCWTYNAESDAMWRIYSQAKDGIRVRTTIQKLFDDFYDSGDTFARLKYFCGKVEYLDEAAISKFMAKITFQDVAFGGQADGFAKLLCIKREAFAHESEVRLLFQDIEPKRGKKGVVTFDFDVNKIGDDLLLDPRLTDHEAIALEAQLRSAGCSLPISKSQLYRVPAFTVPLG